MKEIIDPGIPPIIVYRCDGCHQQVMMSPEDQVPREFCLAIEAAFGYFSPIDGFNYKLALCDDCGMKVTNAIKQVLGIEIPPGYGMEDPFFNEVHDEEPNGNANFE